MLPARVAYPAICREFLIRRPLMAAAPATREGTVTLPDGRRLAWSSGGARSGVPVIYLHGAIGTPVRRTPELDALIAALGIHYIAVSRPGFGRSDPCPGRRIADFPADLEQLADRLGLGRFAVVGVSAGGPYALACARALPERAIATAAVSSLSPLCAPHAGPWMPVHLRLALRALVRRPDLVARSSVRVMKLLERHPRALGRLATLGATPADRRLLAGGEMGADRGRLVPRGGRRRRRRHDRRLRRVLHGMGLRPGRRARRGSRLAWRARPLRARGARACAWPPRSRAAARNSTRRTATSSSAAAWPRCSARWSARPARRRDGVRPRAARSGRRVRRAARFAMPAELSRRRRPARQRPRARRGAPRERAGRGSSGGRKDR